MALSRPPKPVGIPAKPVARPSRKTIAARAGKPLSDPEAAPYDVEALRREISDRLDKLRARVRSEDASRLPQNCPRPDCRRANACLGRRLPCESPIDWAAARVAPAESASEGNC